MKEHERQQPGGHAMLRESVGRMAGLVCAGIALLAAGIAGAAGAPLLKARVTKVNDGDSIEVELDSGPARVRLSAIDTPEYDQPHGAESSAALKSMLPIGSAVELEVVTQDQFRRLVAVVWLRQESGRLNVNEAMLLAGHAWAYRRYAQDVKFCDLEQEARSRKLGLWAGPVSQWIYPPEWRLLKNGEIRTLPEPYEETREKCVTVLKSAGAATYEPPR